MTHSYVPGLIIHMCDVTHFYHGPTVLCGNYESRTGTCRLAWLISYVCRGAFICVSWRIDMCDTATHCNTLQHTATHCNTLRHPWRIDMWATTHSLSGNSSCICVSWRIHTMGPLSSVVITSHERGDDDGRLQLEMCCVFTLEQSCCCHHLCHDSNICHMSLTHL